MLPPEGIVPLVVRTVCPGFLTLTVLEVISPQAFVHSSIDVLVDTKAIRLVVSPESIVNIAVNVNESALAMRPVFPPLT